MSVPGAIPPDVVVDVFGLPRLWLGAIAAVVGLMFWIVGFVALNWIFERYFRDADRPDAGTSDRP